MLREKLVKIGAKVVRHGRYVTLPIGRVYRAEEPVSGNPAPDQ
jgi:hypothetical protein